MKRLLLLSSFLTLSFLAFTQSLTTDQKKALDRADMAKEIAQQSNSTEDWKAAIDEFKKVTNIAPDYAPVFYELGNIYKKLQDYENAISSLKKYLILDPNSQYKDEIMTDINKLEYLRDRNKIQVKETTNLYGNWASPQKSAGTTRPVWIFKIDEFNGELRVSINSKSAYYRADFTYPTAIALKKGTKVNFMFTTDATTDIKAGLNQASDAFNAADMVANYVNPLNNLPFGVAGDVLSMVPASGAVNEKTQYVFSLDVSNPDKITGKVNVKKYVSTSAGVKVTSDEIKDVELNKISTSDLALISEKNLYRAKSYRNPQTALILSIIIPGGGQYYNNQPLKGLLITTATPLVVVGGLLAAGEIGRAGDENKMFSTIFIITGSFTYIYSLIDAPITANKINKECGYLIGDLYENKSFKLKLSPDFQALNVSGKPTISSGFKLALKFK